MASHALFGMSRCTPLTEIRRIQKLWSMLALIGLLVVLFATDLRGQGIDPYPNAITDRLVHTKTPMAPPAVNVPFLDPDFGSQMVRVTDENSNFLYPGGYLRTEGTGNANMWSSDTAKFYVIGQGGVALAYGFDASTMNITSLPGAAPGQGLRLPLRAGASFSFVDPDLIYGTTGANPLVISSYRFSTGALSTVIDTTKCGTEPPLIPGLLVRSDDDVTPTLDDGRISISEGGPSFDQDMFVVVYDKQLGCRWYNTQTGEIGGQWGPSGAASIPDSFLIADALLSRSGQYVKIAVAGAGWYVWDLETLQVAHCPLHSDLRCAGYTTMGYNSVIQDRGDTDPMDIVKRPFDNVAQAEPLVWPLPSDHFWGADRHFTWSNVNVEDNVPVCVSSYDYVENYGIISYPWEGEIFCIETDGIASTIWRFAHNRADWYQEYFNTQPLGSISRDGKFFLFTSGWDEQVGTEANGTPRSDVWIVKLH